jgi:UDP-N-acetylmuramate: L-alanyl-gamma-D-glutamyl-meso-diaminopimelate ligase
MRIHVVGVAGTGMGALAGLLVELGHQVSGSDTAFDPPIGPELERWGVHCLKGFDPAHLEPAPELVVVGNVCKKDNPEAVRAFELGLDVTHIAGALERFVLPGTTPLVVAGTHGKTTTSALAAWLLEASGHAPGFLIGGLPKNFERSFRAPEPTKGGSRRLALVDLPKKASPFVIEGDEYDTAFFEKTAKFLHYRAKVAIVTSIEHDHIDIYPTLESYLAAFQKFVERVPEDGLIVANAADPHVAHLVGGFARAPVAWYALEGQATSGVAPHWLAAPAAAGTMAQQFDLFAGGVYAGRLALPLHGRHNLANAVAAIGAVTQGLGVPLDAAGRALSAFRGVRRRLDLLGEPRGISVYDDFAHHPSAVVATLSALRARHPSGRLFAVFEPRSATACRSLHQKEYAKSFAPADAVLLPPLGRSNIAAGERLDLTRLVDELCAGGKAAQSFAGVDAIVTHLAEHARPGDVIALLSNGAFGGIHGKLIAALCREPVGESK